MYGCLLGTLPRQDGAGATPDEEGGGERVAPQDGQVEETVATGVLDVQVALVAYQGVSDAFVSVQQRQIEGCGSILVTLIQLLRKLLAFH